jgi:hypothetical protein
LKKTPQNASGDLLNSYRIFETEQCGDIESAAGGSFMESMTKRKSFICLPPHTAAMRIDTVITCLRRNPEFGVKDQLDFL